MQRRGNPRRPRDMYPVTMLDSPQQQRFQALYQANYPRILGYALRRTASAEDAADVVADTFAIAWRKLAEIPAGDEATLWLYGVTRRVVANLHRKQASRNAVVEMLAREYKETVWVDPLPGGGPDPALAAAWAALRPADQEVLGLAVWETLATEQIAAVIGCGRTAAKVRVHRARRRFARELERRGVGVSAAGRGVEASGAGRGALKPSALKRHV